MNFKCDCSLRTKFVGDGCSICNTDYAIDLLNTPEELVTILSNNGFSEDQAKFIAKDVYSPMCVLISVLNNKINQISSKLN